jgi:hypothetical protein
LGQWLVITGFCSSERLRDQQQQQNSDKKNATIKPTVITTFAQQLSTYSTDSQQQQQEFILGQHIVNNLLFDFTVALCIANEHMAIAVASLLFLGDCEILRQHY